MPNARGAPPEDPSPDPVSEPRGPYPPWATVGLGLIVVTIFIAVQVLVTIVFIAADVLGTGGSFEDTAAEIATDGTLLSIATLCTTIVCGVLILALVRLRRGPSIRDYLGLSAPRPGPFFVWLGATVLFVLASDFLTRSLDRDVVHEFMLDSVSSAKSLPLFAVALVLGAPLFEELLFRGFLLPGLRRAGVGAAVLLTSLAFALMHMPQYGPYEVASIFVLGILLAVARLRTGSLWTPIAMHALINAIATAETIWVLRQNG